jgi:hypothetical protein
MAHHLREPHIIAWDAEAKHVLRERDLKILCGLEALMNIPGEGLEDNFFERLRDVRAALSRRRKMSSPCELIPTSSILSTARL